MGSNPWLKKNPFLSLWLSAANSAANTARGKATASIRRQSTAAINRAGQDVADLWLGALTGGASKPRTKRKVRR